MKKLISASLGIAALSLVTGCSSVPYSETPSLDVEKLPHVRLISLQPREVTVDVKNERPINVEAGNSIEVEAAVRRALVSALTRDEIEVKKISKNSLAVIISDYTGTNAEGACVKVTGNLQTFTKAYVNAESFSCQHRTAPDSKVGGDVSMAYEAAVARMLAELDKKLPQVGAIRAKLPPQPQPQSQE